MALHALPSLDDGDALSELLGFVDGGGACSWGEGLPAFDAPAEPAARDTPAFRCLEEGHGALCERCTAPPPLGDAARYELVGDPGKKNGEKLLRAALSRTSEWASSASREDAAATLRAQSPRLAEALLARRSGSMTKADLLLLCNHWRRRSQYWRLRGNRPPRQVAKARAKRLPASSGQLAVERPLFPPPLRLDSPGSLHASSLWAHIGTTLRPLSLRCGLLMTGSGAAALAARDPAAARLYRREVALVSSIEAEWLGRQAALPTMLLGLHAAEQQLPAAAASAPAASYAFPPAVQLMPLLTQTAVSYFSELRAFGLQRLSEPGNSIAELTWLEESQAELDTTVELLQQVAALLAASLRNGTAAAHVTMASMLLEFFLTFIVTKFNAFSQRRKWLEALPPADDDAFFDAPRKPLMSPVRTPNIEGLTLGLMGAVAQ